MLYYLGKKERKNKKTSLAYVPVWNIGNGQLPALLAVLLARATPVKKNRKSLYEQVANKNILTNCNVGMAKKG